MTSDPKRRGGFYWVRPFEGQPMVAEYIFPVGGRCRLTGGHWHLPGSEPCWRNDEVCELLGPRLLPPKDAIRKEPTHATT